MDGLTMLIMEILVLQSDAEELMTYMMSVQVELSITLFALKYQPGVTLLGNY
jgi:hypothetical protein